MWREEVELVKRGDTLYGLLHGFRWRPQEPPGEEMYLVEQVLPLTPSGRVFVCSQNGRLLPRPFHYRVLRREDGDFGYDGSRAELRKMAREAVERQRIASLQKRDG